MHSNQNDVRLNLLGGLSLSNEAHEVKWTNLYVRTTTKRGFARSSAADAIARIRRFEPAH